MEYIEIEQVKYNIKTQLPYLLHSKLPHIVWICKEDNDKIISSFINTKTNESHTTELVDLLEAIRIRDELLINNWNMASLPSIRLIYPDGSYKDSD